MIMFLEFSFYHELVKYVCQLKNKNNRSLSKIQSRETVHRKVIHTYIGVEKEGSQMNCQSLTFWSFFTFYLYKKSQELTVCK